MSEFKDLNHLIKTRIKDQIDLINKEIPSNININFKHICDRMCDREIDILDVIDTLTCFRTRHLCEFIYLISLEKAPFRIEIKGKQVILCLGKRNDEWVFNTVLDPKKHSKYSDEKKGGFYRRINCKIS